MSKNNPKMIQQSSKNDQTIIQKSTPTHQKNHHQSSSFPGAYALGHMPWCLCPRVYAPGHMPQGICPGAYAPEHMPRAYAPAGFPNRPYFLVSLALFFA